MFPSRLKLTIGPSYCKWRALSNKKKVYYAVGRGKNVGVFETWKECESSVKGYPNSRFQKFTSPEEAEKFVQFWEEYTKLMYVELNSLNEKSKNWEKERLTLEKSLTQIISEMALLRLDFERIKNAATAWYEKKSPKKSNFIGKKGKGNMGFVKFKSEKSSSWNVDEADSKDKGIEEEVK